MQCTEGGLQCTKHNAQRSIRLRRVDRSGTKQCSEQYNAMQCQCSIRLRVDTEHSLILSREGLILTMSILPCSQGWISRSIPVNVLMMRRIYPCSTKMRGGIGKSTPNAKEVSRDPPLQVLRGMDFNVVAFDYRIYADPSTRMAPTKSGAVRDSHAVYSRAVGKVGSCVNKFQSNLWG